jgi:hypothetical protein
MLRLISACALAVVLLGTCPHGAGAAEWFVRAGSAGPGTSAAPFGRIQEALDVAQPGDRVTVAPGIYRESLHSVRSGGASAAVTLRSAEPRGSVIVTAAGRVLTVGHAYLIVDGLIFDGQYGRDDTVRLSDRADHFILRNSEVRRSTYDLIDMGAPRGVLIDHCLVHHALNAAGGRTDAHGIVAGAAQDLTVRDTEIHTFSGDGIQLDPGRSAPGWNRVTLERDRIWLAPLPAAENGFAAGTVAGENAVDTKASSSLPRATLVIRDVVAVGFRNGLITNMAAFNLKENIDATLDRVTVADSEIALRLRGPSRSMPAGAWVLVKNAVVHDVHTAFRYEDNIQNLRIWNSTVGGNVTRPFQAASSVSSGLDVKNLLLLGTTRPREALGASNMTVGASAFVNAAAGDYSLAPGARAIDAGVTIAGVATDRAGVARPQGRGYDIGAYERRGRVSSSPSPPPPFPRSITAPRNVSLNLYGVVRSGPDDEPSS